MKGKIVIKLGALEDMLAGVKSGYSEPEMEDENGEEEDESNEWECPECGTEVKAGMPKSKMQCPCCDAYMVKS